MNLYLYKRKDQVDWDEPEGFVVRSETKSESRELVGYHFHDWEITRLATGVTGKAEIVLEAFKNG